MLDALWRREWTLVLSNTVLTEYAEILKLEAVALNLTVARIDQLLDALCSLADRHHLSGSWVPVLTDPDDESLVHLAMTAQAGSLISHNLRHLAPARKLGITVLEPKDFPAIPRA